MNTSKNLYLWVALISWQAMRWSKMHMGGTKAFREWNLHYIREKKKREATKGGKSSWKESIIYKHSEFGRES